MGHICDTAFARRKMKLAKLRETNAPARNRLDRYVLQRVVLLFQACELVYLQHRNLANRLFACNEFLPLNAKFCDEEEWRRGYVCSMIQNRVVRRSVQLTDAESRDAPVRPEPSSRPHACLMNHETGGVLVTNSNERSVYAVRITGRSVLSLNASVRLLNALQNSCSGESVGERAPIRCDECERTNAVRRRRQEEITVFTAFGAHAQRTIILTPSAPSAWPMAGDGAALHAGTCSLEK